MKQPSKPHKPPKPTVVEMRAAQAHSERLAGIKAKIKLAYETTVFGGGVNQWNIVSLVKKARLAAMEQYGLSWDDACKVATRKSFSRAVETVAKTRKSIEERAGRPKRRDRSWWRRYRDYLASPEWAAFRGNVLVERGYKCEWCAVAGESLEWHVHHVSYKRLGAELPEDIKLLCPQCHQAAHPGKRIRLPRRKKTQENAA